MPEQDVDLWPSDLGLEALPRSPVTILRQQAAALSAKLDNRIQARIHSTPAGYGDRQINIKLRHRMVLVVPNLEDYELDLLNVSHGDNVYPVFAQLKDQHPAAEIGSEKELLEWLRVSFASETTRRALGSLLSLA